MRSPSRRSAQVSFIAVAAAATVAVPALAHRTAFLDRFAKIGTVASMMPGHGPAKGDQNPYGVAVVSRTTGALVRGDVLVSNFNNAKNEQGTGSSIIEVSPRGRAHVFAVVPRPTSTPAVGLTTALAELKSGFVIVGSLPAPGGKSRAARAGALTILNSRGHVVSVIAGADINGPWDMTAVQHGDRAELFVTNVLNGTVAANGHKVARGTVVRVDLRIQAGHVPAVTSNQVIATGFTEHTDPNALVVGPTGVGLASNGTLYVADSSNNRIAAVPDAATGTSVLGAGGKTVAHGGKLNDPLGLTIVPGGDVVSMNGGNGDVVETTAAGRTAAARTLVPNGAGDLFGVALVPSGHGLYFVNDNGSGPAANSLQILH